MRIFSSLSNKCECENSKSITFYKGLINKELNISNMRVIYKKFNTYDHQLTVSHDHHYVHTSFNLVTQQA